MRVISKHPKLSEFWSKYPNAEKPLLAWHRLAEHAHWASFAEIRKDYPHADMVGRFVVFNIGGNKYRLIVRILHRRGRIYISHVLTHRDYSLGGWKD